jgi:hypothetical protein
MKTFFYIILFSISNCVSGQGLINSGGYIINSGSPYIISNNSSLTNDGTWTKASEVLIFNGTVASEIKGLTSNYNNIEINNTGGITLNSTNLNTIDNLTINASCILNIAPTSKLSISTNLTNNGGTAGLVLKSDATGSASLIHSTASVPATVEQYQTDEDAAAAYYHLISSPISNATAAVCKFTDVQTYVYSYNSATSPKWTSFASSASPLNAGQGYLLNYHNVSGARTPNYTGTLNTGNISPALNATAEKFSLVGNPYPCAIDWEDNLGWDRSNLSNTYYVYLPAISTYGSYTTTENLSLSGLTKDIAAGQGFFVYATASSPAITIKDHAKVHNNSILKSASQTSPLLKFHISNNSNKYSDEAVVLFSKQGTTGFDPELDALKMFSLNAEASQIYTLSENYLVINSLPQSYKDSIPLFFKCNKADT